MSTDLIKIVKNSRIAFESKVSSIKKEDARPFKVAKNIKFLVIDKKTGRKADFGSKTTIIEAFKKNGTTKNLLFNNDLNLKLDKNNILKFY